MKSRIKICAAAVSAAFSFPVQSIAADTPTVQVAPVVVTATRVEQSSFDVPGAIDVISGKALKDGQSGVNLSESLWRAPGTVVLNRQNYAQDLQVSIRGFGARSAFGTRSIKLIQDGIPLTMPDGQGQTATFNLANAERVEVLRGPFSAGYGNQSGGVIQLFTADGPKDPEVEARAFSAGFGTFDVGLKAAGQSGKVNYNVDANEFHTDGYRGHSAAERTTANAKLKFALESQGTLTLLVNSLRQAGTQDALGLTLAQFSANPKQAGAGAEQFNTRKDIEFNQAGLVLDQPLGQGDVFRLSGYTGKRSVTQFQNTCTNGLASAGCQNLSTSPGGVVAFDRSYYGIGTRLSRDRQDWKVSVGVDYEQMDEARKGYNNFLGSAASPTVLGVKGTLRRDEQDRAKSINLYVEGEWRITQDLALTAGTRRTRVDFTSSDHYLTDGVDSSGNLSFSNTSAMMGLLWHATPTVNLFANLGRGFETPTFTEMAYRAGNAAGLNFNLKPAKSLNAEAGVKAFVGSGTRIEAAAFDIGTWDEIVVLSASAGRTVYQNAGRTNRQGYELSVDSDLGAGFSTFWSYTRMKARYVDPFGTALAGNNIAGTPSTMLHGEVVWKDKPSGFSAALEAHMVGRVFANDANSIAADGYNLLNLRLGLEQKIGKWQFKEFARCDNLTDKVYAGSVIVNQTSSQFFESAPGRNYTVGASANYKF